MILNDFMFAKHKRKWIFIAVNLESIQPPLCFNFGFFLPNNIFNFLFLQFQWISQMFPVPSFVLGMILGWDFKM